jgi:hypothetical protein
MNAVYFHIAKTAGMTIAEVLKLDLYRYPHTSRNFTQKGIVTFGHLNYRNLLRKGIVSKEFDESTFKFTFVREPFDRAVSSYFWCVKKEVIPVGTSFLEFTRSYLSQTKNQYDYVAGIELGFVGRYEYLIDDLEKVAKIIGIKLGNIPHFNQIIREPFQSYYNREAAVNVRNFYKKDFNVFGYNHNLLYP